jgi:hypothetical protein
MSPWAKWFVGMMTLYAGAVFALVAWMSLQVR